MKVTIDTQQDTFEDLQKILHLLQGILERKTTSPQQPADNSAMMNMFSDEPASATSNGTAPDFSSFLQLTKQPEKKEATADTAKIELY